MAQQPVCKLSHKLYRQIPGEICSTTAFDQSFTLRFVICISSLLNNVDDKAVVPLGDPQCSIFTNVRPQNRAMIHEGANLSTLTYVTMIWMLTV